MNIKKEKFKTILLHYSAPPVIGGVEAVINAHASQFVAAGLPIKIIAGRGDSSALPRGVRFVRIPILDTLHPEIQAATNLLNQGNMPENFESLTEKIVASLRPELSDCDNLIVHNVLTKHFNLPLTAALFRLMDEFKFHTFAWCHDLTWTSPNSRKNVYPDTPWTLLKSAHKNTTYVAISEKRRQEAATSFGIDPNQVPVIHNGVDAETLLALSDEGLDLIDRLKIWKSDIILLMPVRITEAKNIEFAMHTIMELMNLGCAPNLIISGPPDPHDSASMKYYQDLLNLKSKLGLDEYVHFVFESGLNPEKGYMIDRGILSELFRVTDAVFMPSHREGFGMPILEAGLIGLPIISTPIPAVQDLLPDGALIFEKGLEPGQLAEQILNWIKNKPELKFRIRVRQNLTWHAIFEKQILPMLEGKTES